MGRWQVSSFVEGYPEESKRLHFENNTNLQICNCSQCVLNFLLTTGQGRDVIYHGIYNRITGYSPYFPHGTEPNRQLFYASESEYFDMVRKSTWNWKNRGSQ